MEAPEVISRLEVMVSDQRRYQRDAERYGFVDRADRFRLNVTALQAAMNATASAEEASGRMSAYDADMDYEAEAALADIAGILAGES